MKTTLLFLLSLFFFLYEANSQITSWSSTTSLLANRQFASSVILNGRIYVTGGDLEANYTGTNTVYRATLNTDGSISGWTTSTMPVYKAAHSTVVWDGRLYVLGGYNDWGSDTRTVRFASINADGSLGSWSITIDLPAARIGLSSTVWNGRIYATGGASGVVITASNSLYIGTIDGDGSIPSWTSTTLPEARAFHTALAINDRLYIIGGGTGAWADTNATSSVYFAPINVDGSLGTWSSTTALPASRNRHGAFFDVVFSQLYIIGGKDPDQNTTSTVWYASVQSDGTITGWSTTTALPASRKDFTVSVNPSDNRAYIIGGTNASDAVVNTVWYTVDPPLPIQLASFTGIVVNGNDVFLEWTTISEINNYGFFVQKYDEVTNQFITIDESFQAGAGYTLEPQYYTWMDESAVGSEIIYRLKQVDNDGLEHYYGPITVTLSPTGIKDVSNPTVFRLEQNYPNPFNPATRIGFSVGHESFVTLKIYDLMGRIVGVLVDRSMKPGSYELQWDANHLPSGLYFYRLQASTFIETKKLLLLR